MRLRKSLVVAGVATVVGLTAATGVGVAAAQSTSGSGDSLVQKLAKQFNLKEEDVQKVFDEDKSARQAERQAEMSQELQSAVDSGKITSEQKTLIENKLKEVQTAHESERAALEDWAKQNNIDVKYVMMGGRHGGDSDRLQSAVDAGKITAEQKTLIEKKQDELKQARDAARDALEDWAEQNDIDMEFLQGSGPKGHGMRGGPQ